MHFLSLRAATLAVALALALFGGAAKSSTQGFQGQLARDNALVLFQFTLATPGDLRVTSFSHSGGLNGAGSTVPEGGFAPVLALFDAGGDLLGFNAGSSNACVGPGSFCWDARLQLSGLAAGSYLLVLSQDDNVPLGSPIPVDDPASAYSRYAEPHYTAAYLGQPEDGSLNFVRVDGSLRTGLWALDVQVDALVSQVPEPPTALLLAIGGVGLVRLLGRRPLQGRC